MKNRRPSTAPSQGRAKGTSTKRPPAGKVVAKSEGTSKAKRGAEFSGRAARMLADSQKLLHELQVYQSELELQNDELIRTRLEVERGLTRYTELFDFAPIGYAILGPGDRVRQINHAGATILGHQRARVDNRSFGDFLHPAARPTFDELFDSARLGRPRAVSELELERLGQERRFVRLSATWLGKELPEVLVVFEDTTQRRVEMQRLVDTEEELRQVDRRKDEFMAALSHELRNPLTSIRNSLFVLGKKDPAAPEGRRALEILSRQVNHLGRLVDDLLDVSRITSGRVELQRRPLALQPLIAQAVEDHRGDYESKGVRLQMDMPSEAIWANVDPDRVVQAVSNLLVNARDFTEPRGRVEVSLKKAKGQSTLRVADDGAGIEPSILATLFHPFTQGPQPAHRPRGGLGLGLAMVKGLAELHGGTSAITSEGVGKGTAVSVTLPTISAPPAEAPPKPPTNGHRPRQVLVIEDSPDGAESLREVLSSFGHNVQVAFDGQQGMDVARRFHPEVVLCDIGLPGMDGYQVAERFRADPALRDVYMVALSGYAQEADLERAAVAGFNQHVAKPPDLPKLQALIDDAPPLKAVEKPQSEAPPRTPSTKRRQPRASPT